MWNCNEALAFGRRTMGLQVIRLGWNPRTSTPDRVGSEFRRREADLVVTPPAPTVGPAPPAPTPGTGPLPAAPPTPEA